MHKISYYVLGIVVVGSAITGLWIYQRYFKAAEQPFLYFPVDRGTIQESIKVRSEIVPQKTFDLEFPFTGTVKIVFVHDGDTVTGGQRLMALDTKNLSIQASQLSALVAQRQVALAKLKAGATAEDIKISQSQLAAAQVALTEAKSNLLDKIRDAYAKADDSIRAKADLLFDNPLSAAPTLKNDLNAGATVRNDLDFARPQLGLMLGNWNASLSSLTTSSDLSAAIEAAQAHVADVSLFLNMLSPVVNSQIASANVSQTTIDAYKAALSAARVSMSVASANLEAAQEKYNLAVANAALYQEELAYKEAPARPEDLASAQAAIDEAQGQFAAVEEDMRRATLTAPTAGTVSKVEYEVGEVFRPGTPAISLTTTGLKLQSDVSELDIAKVSEGSSVAIALDAFPGKQFTGQVVSIDPQEVVKTEDKYYRVYTIFDPAGAEVRSGMSADATILGSTASAVLRIPEIALYTDGNMHYVKVLKPGLEKAVSEDSLERIEVETGAADGDYVEIKSGLAEGQTVVVSAE